MHLVCIYDYITVLQFCVGILLELPSNFCGDFLLESSKVPTIALLAARLRRKNDFEYPPLTLWIFSAEGLFLFRVCRALRSAPNAIFTGGVVTGNGTVAALAPPGGAVAQRLRGFKSAEPKKTVKRSSRRTGVNLQFFFGVALRFGVKRGEQPLFRGSSASKSLALFWFSFGVKREHPSACAHNTKKRPALPVEMRGALVTRAVCLMPPAGAVPQRTGRQ